MRRFSANYIFPVNSKPLKNGIVETTDEGMITNIIDTEGDLRESARLEFYNGVIVPGFVNCHCHLELTHLKNQLPEGTGLPNFIENIINFRKSEGDVQLEIEHGDAEMQRNGIKAVGDISNLTKSFETKAKSKITYHTFIEAFSIKNIDDQKIFDGCYHNYLEILRVDASFNNYATLKSSIVPHAPYSVSKNLFALIHNFSKKHSPISIHNQETSSENELFQSQTGALYETLKKVGIDTDRINLPSESSLASFINKLPIDIHKLLVHNTFTTLEDIQFANHQTKNIFWTMCPNANLFIENRLPDIPLFHRNGEVITLGTDSLASNHFYSILGEMQTIRSNFPAIPFEAILKWATFNGAKALEFEENLGSIEIGKCPGLNLISNFDFVKMSITEKSLVKVLI